MKKPRRAGPKKGQKYNNYEVVLARKPGSNWWPAKILSVALQEEGNFLVVFLRNQRIAQISGENIKKYTARAQAAFTKPWQKRYIVKINKILAKIKKQPNYIPPEPLVPIENPEEETKKLAPQKSSPKKAEKKAKLGVREKKIAKERKSFIHKNQMKKQRVNDELGSGLTNGINLVHIDIPNPPNPVQNNQERLNDTTHNFQALGGKLVVFTKKFYKILKKKGIEQAAAQRISISLAHFNNNHHPKQTFHQIIRWIQTNTSDHIVGNYESL